MTSATPETQQVGRQIWQQVLDECRELIESTFDRRMLKKLSDAGADDHERFGNTQAMACDVNLEAMPGFTIKVKIDPNPRNRKGSSFSVKSPNGRNDFTFRFAGYTGELREAAKKVQAKLGQEVKEDTTKRKAAKLVVELNRLVDDVAMDMLREQLGRLPDNSELNDGVLLQEAANGRPPYIKRIALQEGFDPCGGACDIIAYVRFAAGTASTLSVVPKDGENIILGPFPFSTLTHFSATNAAERLMEMLTRREKFLGKSERPTAAKKTAESIRPSRALIVAH